MTYIFDNAAPVARSRLSALAHVYDPDTIAALDDRGVAEGWMCLEVGGGLGTITRWLSQRVGARGRVFATDIDTRFLDELGLDNVDVRRHDILASPLPASTFDLAYARLVLEHLSDPDLALRRMIAALKPGGWIVVQDMETMPVEAGSHEPQDRISATAAVMRQIVAAAGVNPRVGPSLGRRLRACRLDHVGCEGRLSMCRGNSAAARLARLNFEQMRESLLASGRLTSDQFDADVALLQNEDYEWRSPILWTAWGQRPVGDL